MKKIGFLLAFSCFLLSGNPASAEPATYERVNYYKVEFDNVKWYQAVAMFFMGLNWDEMTIKTVFKKDGSSENVVSVSAWPNIDEELDDEDRVFHLNVSTAADSFLDFVKETKFKKEEIPALIDLFNYLYDDRTEEIKFDTTNLFEKENGNMHAKFAKKKEGDKNTVAITTFNSAGNKNGAVETVMNPLPEKHLEKIVAQLKIGITVTLTKINPEAED